MKEVQFTALEIPGAFLLHASFQQDDRGSFVKPFTAAGMAALLPGFAVEEVFWSRSGEGVIRGLHFQKPPSAVAKLVFVTQGRIRDALLDLRADSPSFGKGVVIELDEASGAVFIPSGCAHGFEVLEGPAVTCYLQDGGFDPVADAGVRWDSAGLVWQTTHPRLSKRDQGLPPLDEAPMLTTMEWTRRA